MTFTYTASNPCLKGLVQTLPAEEKLGNYTAVDTDDITLATRLSVFYPELMFLCNGTLNGGTIPYSIKAMTPWYNRITLSLTVWRKQPQLGYVQTGTTINIGPHEISSQATNNVFFSDTSLRGNVTFISDVKIEKYDILQFSLPALVSGRRTHIPFLLCEYPEGCATPGCLLPVLQVNFTSSEAVLGKQFMWLPYQVLLN